MSLIALTGAAGSLATDILPGLVSAGHRVRCIDNRPLTDDHDQPSFVVDLADREALARAFDGCAAVVHLAGIPLEDDWERILAVNIDGTQAVLEQARRVGVPKVVLASSVHAAGFVPLPPPGELVPDDVGVRPNTFYGVSKAALEALGSLYHDRWGMDVVCLRIASRFPRPTEPRMLSTWLSPADATRLVLAALDPAVTGFHTVWGVSRNRRSVFDPAGGSRIGFLPQDDAELHAAAVLGRTGDGGVTGTPGSCVVRFDAATTASARTVASTCRRSRPMATASTTTPALTSGTASRASAKRDAAANYAPTRACSSSS